MFYWNTVEIKCDNFYERTEEWGRVGVEGESGVDFMGGFGWGGQRTISSRRGSLLKFVGGVSSEVGDQDGRCTGFAGGEDLGDTGYGFCLAFVCLDLLFLSISFGRWRFGQEG